MKENSWGERTPSAGAGGRAGAGGSGANTGARNRLPPVAPSTQRQGFSMFAEADWTSLPKIGQWIYELDGTPPVPDELLMGICRAYGIDLVESMKTTQRGLICGALRAFTYVALIISLQVYGTPEAHRRVSPGGLNLRLSTRFPGCLACSTSVKQAAFHVMFGMYAIWGLQEPYETVSQEDPLGRRAWEVNDDGSWFNRQQLPGGRRRAPRPVGVQLPRPCASDVARWRQDQRLVRRMCYISSVILDPPYWRGDRQYETTGVPPADARPPLLLVLDTREQTPGVAARFQGLAPVPAWNLPAASLRWWDAQVLRNIWTFMPSFAEMQAMTLYGRPPWSHGENQSPVPDCIIGRRGVERTASGGYGSRWGGYRDAS